MLRLSTVSKMSFKEEAVKHICQKSCSSEQSRSICFAVCGASQGVPIFRTLIREIDKAGSKARTRHSWRDRGQDFINRAIVFVATTLHHFYNEMLS